MTFAPRLIRARLQDLLRLQISNGEPDPGTTLSPAELADVYGVSPTPMREALIELARDRLVDNLPNRGFMVRSLSAAEAREIYPLIWLLEAEAIRQAAPGPEVLDELLRINTDYAAAADPSTVQDQDAHFHRKLISGCPNSSLLELIETLRWRVRRYEIAWMKYARVAWQSAAHHHAMVLALRRGDIERANEVLRDNWTQGLEERTGWLA